MIELGQRVKDTITGFQGIAVGRAVYLNGCVRVQIQSESVSKDGKILEGEWIDEGQLVMLDNRTKFSKIVLKAVGGPRVAPPRTEDPK